MNDNDIIKALGLCGRDASGFDMCVGCPYEKTGCLTKEHHMPHDALDLINRQKAEIEKLKAEIEEMKRGEQMRIEADGLFWEREPLTDKDVQERETFKRLMVGEDGSK